MNLRVSVVRSWLVDDSDSSNNDGDGYKSEVALLQTFSRLFYLAQFVKCWYFFSGVEF